MESRACARNREQLLFLGSMVQDAVIRNLQILSESTQKVSESLKQQHPEINWRAIAGFRNILVHDYLGLPDYELLSANTRPRIEVMLLA